MNQTILDVLSWDEHPLESFSPENATTIARVTYSAHGALNGTMESTYIIHYTAYDINNPHTAESTFTGYTRFTGDINGKKGSVVFTENGEHSNGLISHFTSKENTASGELLGLTGNAHYSFIDGKVVLESDFKIV